MKQFFKSICLVVYTLAALFFAVGCSDDNDLTKTSQFGFFQLKVRKQMQTYALTGGAELENLNDAKKIQIDLIYNNKQVSQTLNLAAVNAEAAESGLSSEVIELLPGEYTLTGYKIYGEFIEGVTQGDKAPVLQEGEPDETLRFIVTATELKVVTLNAVAQRRGYLSLILNKDFSAIQPETKANGYNPEDFVYDHIAKVQVDLKAGQNGALSQYEFKTQRGRNDYLYHTDTLSMRVNEYQLVQMRLLNKKNELIMVVDKPHQFIVVDEKLSREEVDIEMPLTPALKDYMALYNIWKAMDGENWYWMTNGVNTGANFLFTYSDGTPRPIDLWGAQPGVTLDSKGRVVSLNLGAFNAKGMVPDAIGELTALESLYLGSQTDTGQIDGEEGMAVIDHYSLMLQGVDIRSNRMEIAKEVSELRFPNKSTLGVINDNRKPFSFVSYYQMDTNYTNRITGISDAIGNCTELNYLSVAYGLVSELPESIGKLKNLTDLLLVKSQFKRIPEAVFELPELVAFTFAEMKEIDHASIQGDLRRLFDGPSKEKIQMLYLSENALTELPENLANLKALGLLEIADNKLTSVPFLGNEVSIVHCLANGNRLTSIPDNWFNIEDLEKLDLSDNQLTCFPNMFDSKAVFQISEVNMSGNKLERMPSGFNGIYAETLNMNCNLFKELPVEFSQTSSNIDFLQISNNELDTISPLSISNLKNLKALECAGNKLRYVPYQFDVIAFPYMTGIDFSMNQFARFPSEVLYVNFLTELRIANQLDKQNGKKLMKEWPEGLEKHPALRVLDISHNDIRKVQNFPTQLNMLNIQDNPDIYITIPQDVLVRIVLGTFTLYCDETQNVEGI